MEFLFTCLEQDEEEVCGHTFKLPKTRDLAQLGQWIAEHNEVNVPAVLPKEMEEDGEAMDELIQQFIPVKE